jgi:hypothetical protein
MRAAVPPEHRRISFRNAFAARLGGEAISFLTFTGHYSAKRQKSRCFEKRVPLTYGVPALVVDNLLYNLSVVFFVLSGAVVMLLRYPLPPGVYLVLIIIAAVAASGILIAAIAAKASSDVAYVGDSIGSASCDLVRKSFSSDAITSITSSRKFTTSTNIIRARSS